MRKAGCRCLTLALVLMVVGVFVLLPLGAGLGALPREMAFSNGLLASLNHLDQAKWNWAQEKHKSEGDIPTMEDLAPYLGDWTNDIESFVAWGIEYKLTPISETPDQSDVATLTRNISFQQGFSRFWRAGTSFSMQTGWIIPQSRSISWLERYQNNRRLVGAALFCSGLGSLLVFAVSRIRRSRQVSSVAHGHENA